jgi:hypothetical protein
MAALFFWPLELIVQLQVCGAVGFGLIGGHPCFA